MRNPNLTENEFTAVLGLDPGGYRCIITNLATNSVFEMLEKRTKAHMRPFFRDLPDRDKVE